jgi:hypothetical protein
MIDMKKVFPEKKYVFIPNPLFLFKPGWKNHFRCPIL